MNATDKGQEQDGFEIAKVQESAMENSTDSLPNDQRVGVVNLVCRKVFLRSSGTVH